MFLTEAEGNHWCGGMHCRCEQAEAGFTALIIGLACGFHIWTLKREVVTRGQEVAFDGRHCGTFMHSCAVRVTVSACDACETKGAGRT